MYMPDNIPSDSCSEWLALGPQGIIQLVEPQEIMTCYLAGMRLSSAAEKIASRQRALDRHSPEVWQSEGY